MQIVTLTHDWGTDSLYWSQYLGKLMSINDNIKVIELSRNINNFDITLAAFIFENSYKYFPPETIHICLIENIKFLTNEFLVYISDNQYFICRNNGFLSLVFNNIETVKSYKNLENFAESEIIKKIVENIVNKTLDNTAIETDDFIKLLKRQPVYSSDRVLGHVLFIDAYGNIISDINKTDFEQFVANSKFRIIIKHDKYSIDKISKSFSDVDNGEFAAIFNSMNLLEIAINAGNISTLLGIENGMEFRIELIKEEPLEQGKIF